MQTLLKIFIFSALAGFALSVKIINGTKTNEKLMKYMASVQNQDGHVCGGFLISEYFVLTAAHCDDNNPTHVVLGTHDLDNVDKTNIYTVKTCKHPDYKGIASGNDIMLLKLSTKAKLGRKARTKTIKLPSQKMKLKEKTKCRVAGWGLTKTGAQETEVDLRDVEVPVINLKECRDRWNNNIPENVICAGGYNTGKGICQGDSGGPLVCNKQAVGVVSFNSGNNCNYPTKYPNIYTDVSKFIPWIKGILKKKEC